MATVQIAFYKGRSKLSNRAVSWWTRGAYSHCELVVDGWCYSSSVMDKGVRRKLIDMDSGHWDLIELPWADAEFVRDYFDKTDHLGYGWGALVTSQFLNLGIGYADSQFCSEWCANALQIPNASAYSPQTLLELCEFINGL